MPAKPPRRTLVPDMYIHRASGQARVKLNGHHVYLGPWGTDEARERYDATIQAWLENGRRWPPLVQEADTLAALGDRYLEHARAFYIKAGRTTDTVYRIKAALELLYRAGLGDLRPGEFGPLHLQQFQQFLALDPAKRWARSTINHYVHAIVQMFRWAVGQQLVHASVWQALTAVRHVQRGRGVAPGVPPAPERRPVEPPDPRHVKAVLARVRPVVAEMIQLQSASGMRPGEIVAMRRRDLARTRNRQVWVYTPPPEVNKLDHKGKARRVFLGPRAMKILQPRLDRPAEAFLFDSREAKAAARKTPPDPAYGRQRPYSTDSYRRAIERACVAAKIPTWSPNQLRHEKATTTAEREDLDVAMTLLGHSSVRTTLGYVTVHDQRAIKSALKHG